MGARRIPQIVTALCLATAAFSRVCVSQTPDNSSPQPVPAPEAVQTIRSPDGSIEVSINVAGPLSYSVRVDNVVAIAPSKLGLKLRSRATLGQNVELVNATHQTSDSTWENPLGKRRTVRDHYNQVHLLLRERSDSDRSFALVVRAFNDGVAFRYDLLSQPGLREFVLEQELTEFSFPGNYVCYAGEQEKGLVGPQEWQFTRRRLSDIKPESIIGLPLLAEAPAAWIAIAEADLLDWAGLWLAGSQQESAPTTVENAELPPVTLAARLAPRPDGQGVVTAKAPHHSPWRVLIIGRQPGRLIESEIIRNLSTPNQLEDASWVKPGMMAWDHWWTGDTVMDTATMKEYITLAADMGWPYQLIDWGWYGESNKAEADIMHVVQSLDMDEVRRFAAEKGVKLWLWLHWTDVDRNDAYKKAFPLYKQWGIAGVKIDFMDRDDQEMVQWYEKITRAAAEHELMVNFHGAYKTAGFDRTFPNQITREGVLGNEYNKWSSRVTPEHRVTLPFTRFLLGPADYTPGGFLNRQPPRFKPQTPTLVQSTRAAELALFVVYDSPLCCVCDHPNHYRERRATGESTWQPGADFLKLVPTVWDETRVLDGAVSQHIVVARRAGDSWYLGALTNSEPRELAFNLDFLGGGTWKMSVWKDGPDAHENAEHVATEERTVTASDTLTWRLAPAGGCVARLQKQ